MRALMWQGPSDMRTGAVPEPRSSPGWVIVRPSVTGICGSDVTAYSGRMGVSPPGQVRGHEFAGVVVDTADVDLEWLDHYVVVNPLVSCGACPACVRGRDNRCDEQRSLGILLPGSLAELVAVPTANLVAVPSGLAPTTAAGTEPLAQALHDVTLGWDRDDDVHVMPRTMLVVGVGSIGYLAVQVARHLGVERIDVVDTSAQRRSDALLVGADRAEPTVETLDDEVPGGYEAVLDVVGSVRTRADALRCVSRGGTAVLVGLHSADAGIDWRAAIRREVVVRCSNASTRAEFRQAANLLIKGVITPAARIRRYAFDEAPEVFDRLASNCASDEKAFIDPPPSRKLPAAQRARVERSGEAW